MNKWLRRIRGAFGMGLAWGFAWFGAGMIMLLGMLVTTGSTGADVPYPLGFGLLGFLGGVTFSGVLGLTEGSRRFSEMSLPRFAGWGALGAGLFSVAFTFLSGQSADVLLILAPIFALAGAGCAGGSLALARMAEEPQMIDAGDDIEDAGLTAAERRELLGDGD